MTLTTLLLLLPHSSFTHVWHIASEQFNSADDYSPVWEAYRVSNQHSLKRLLNSRYETVNDSSCKRTAGGTKKCASLCTAVAVTFVGLTTFQHLTDCEPTKAVAQSLSTNSTYCMRHHFTDGLFVCVSMPSQAILLFTERGLVQASTIRALHMQCAQYSSGADVQVCDCLWCYSVSLHLESVPKKSATRATNVVLSQPASFSSAGGGFSRVPCYDI